MDPQETGRRKKTEKERARKGRRRRGTRKGRPLKKEGQLLVDLAPNAKMREVDQDVGDS